MIARYANIPVAIDPDANPDSYTSPLPSMVPRKSGTMSVTRRDVRGSTPIIGLRQALMRGVRPVTLELEPGRPLRIHELRSKKDGVWMTDLPEEIFQISEMLHTANPYGRILVGGLGLGILPLMLFRDLVVNKGTNPAEVDISVVEINRDVIKLCGRSTLFKTLQGDIKKFLEEHLRPFDFYLLDTWQGTNEMTWWADVLPMRLTIRKRFGVHPRIHCWAEDIMQGQVIRSLQTGGKLKEWYYEFLPPMTARQARWFVEHIGYPQWEDKYGKAVRKGINKVEKRKTKSTERG